MAIRGVVTAMDREHGYLVLQEGDQAVAIRPDTWPERVEPGASVQMQAGRALPQVPPLADYPWQPSEVKIVPDFQVPNGGTGYFVARCRAWVTAPETGEYHFWIVSDDGSELWLSEDEAPRKAKPVAQVDGWVRPGEWERFSTQKANAVRLEAGKRYYLEVVYEQRAGDAHLALGWSGPSWDRRPIPSAALQAWMDLDNPNTRRGGVLQEVWRGQFVDGAWWLGNAHAFEGKLNTLGTRWERLAEKIAAPAQPLSIRQILAPAQRYRLASVTGVLSFVGQNLSGTEIEVEDGRGRLTVSFSKQPVNDLRSLRGRRVRVTGVALPTLNSNNELLLTHLLAGSEANIDPVDPPPPAEPAETLALHMARRAVTGTEPGVVRVVGEIVEIPDPRTVVLQDRGTYQASFSSDGRTWIPFGPPIEVDMPWRLQGGVVLSSNSGMKEAAATFEELRSLNDLSLINIGGAGHEGHVEIQGRTVRVKGAGAQIWGLSDQFAFATTALEGPAVVEARLTGLESTDPNAKAGIMLRESLDPAAQFVDVVYCPNAGLAVEWRQQEEGMNSRKAAGMSVDPPFSLRLSRVYSRLAVQLNHPTAFKVGNTIEAVGRLIPGGDGAQMIQAHVRPPTLEKKNARSQSRWPVFNLRDLSNPAGPHSRLDFFKARGVVTFSGRVNGRPLLALQDETAGLWVGTHFLDTNSLPPAGRLVEIQSTPGWRRPLPDDLVADNLLVTGEGDFPTPVRHPLEYALPRRGAGIWVESAGTVRSVEPDGTLRLRDQGEILSVWVDGLTTPDAAQWVGREVRVRGVVHYPDDRALLLLVPGPRFVDIEAEPVPLGQLPPTALSALKAASLVNTSAPRTRVSGTVLYANAEIAVIRDGEVSATVSFANGQQAQLGQRLTVAGFPESLSQRLRISDALLLKAEENVPLPAPLPYAESGDHSLAAVSGTFLGTEVIGPHLVFRLRTERGLVRALWRGEDPAPSWPEGSVVRLQGLKAAPDSPLLPREVVRTDASVAGHLLVRTASDVIQVTKPRWWVISRTLLLAALAGGILALAVWQIERLRRRVSQRTRELEETMSRLQKETQAAATLAERNRLAGEIHDSMEQGLNALLLHLDALLKNNAGLAPEVRDKLGVLRNMVTYSRSEVKSAVWDLQSPWLRDRPLAEGLEAMVAQLAPGHGKIHLSTEGAPRTLPPQVEHHILRVAQEGITNALKHAGDTEIHVTLAYHSDHLRVCVEDHGRGFAPGSGPVSAAGKFGLRGLHSRARRLGATLRIDAAPGSGTRIEMLLPYPPASL